MKHTGKNRFRGLGRPALRFGVWASIAAASSLLAFFSCSPIFLDDNSGVGQADRRVYVNDQAPNDSLTRALLSDGVKFVLQPGKPYVFSVATNRTADILDVYTYQAGDIRAYKQVPATAGVSRELFPLSAGQSGAQFFLARLLTGGDPSASGALGRVALASLDTAIKATDTLKVRLLFIQTLQGLPDAASKQAFAADFFGVMNQIYGRYGIAVSGSIEIVNPTAKAMVFPFTNTYVPLNGQRVANTAHLYLVDNISVPDTSTGPKGDVLGFAPREVADLSDHRESRVILANHASPDRLAITACHELGHFFGLRHTVSTYVDKLQDKDDSNTEDGFTDTRFCSLDIAFAKRGAAPALPSGSRKAIDAAGSYCLRVAEENSCTNTGCDLGNLMHPVECGSTPQITLSAQQISFFKRNLALYKR